MDLTELKDDGVTIVFRGAPSEVDVYTLADALSAFADALREINEIADPEFELDVTIEATEAGSFITRLRFRKLAKSPFAIAAANIVLSILSAYIYDLMTYKHTFTT